MNAKKTVMGFAALIILIFHFYTPNNIIGVIGKAGYIGVDFFFFVSALCLGSKEKIKFSEFIVNRLLFVYLPFVIMCVIAACVNNWRASRLVTVVTGIEFLLNGGGSFLWYFPALMILYLVVPSLLEFKIKAGLPGLAVALACWIALVCVMQFIFSYTKLFILINRLPLFLLGFYWDKISFRTKAWLKHTLIALGMIAGGVLIYMYGTTIRLNQPIKDFYYIVAIPFVVATTFFFEELHSKYKFPVLSFVGTVSLELYALQMIFGFKLEMMLLNATKLYFLSFIATIITITVAAVLFHYTYKWIMKKLTAPKKNKKKSNE